MLWWGLSCKGIGAVLSREVSESVRAAVSRHQRRGGLKKHLLLTILDAGKSQVKAFTELMSASFQIASWQILGKLELLLRLYCTSLCKEGS